jgi:hypothetical protein
MPVKPPGTLAHAEFCWPNGPSLEKWTKSGRKLRQKSNAKTAASNTNTHPLAIGFRETRLVS